MVPRASELACAWSPACQPGAGWRPQEAGQPRLAALRDGEALALTHPAQQIRQMRFGFVETYGFEMHFVVLVSSRQECRPVEIAPGSGQVQGARRLL